MLDLMQYRVIDAILNGALSKWDQCAEECIEKIRGNYANTLVIISYNPDLYVPEKEEHFQDNEATFFFQNTELPSFFGLNKENIMLREGLIGHFKAQGFHRVWADTEVSVPGASYLFLQLIEKKDE